MQGIYSILVSLVFNISVSSCSNEASTQLVHMDEIQRGTSVATFAGGCFWCVEAVFERVQGVKDVVSGYSGGEEENPTYKQVSYGMSTHAEAVQVYFDPEVVSYQELLDIFFVAHDPTQLNKQGPDVGKQYRSAIYYHDNKQKKAIEKTIAKLNDSGKLKKKIVTEVAAFDKFWLAEDYHQNYYELNPGNPYIINVAVPKVKKFKKYFPEKVKAKYKAER